MYGDNTNMININLQDLLIKCKINGFNSSGVFAGGYDVIEEQSQCVGCSSNNSCNLNINLKHITVYLDLNNISDNNTNGIGTGGIFASYIGLNEDDTINNININVNETTVIGKHIGKDKYNSTYGGIFAGYIYNGIININNCYTTGNIKENSYGIVGFSPSYPNTVALSINKCYTSGDNDEYNAIAPLLSNYAINSCYADIHKHQDYVRNNHKIIGKLDKLSKKKWKSHNHSLPTLIKNKYL